MKPVAVVQHEPSVPPGSIAAVLEEASCPAFVVEAWRTETWPEARDLGGLVVMGGTMNVDQLDDYPFLRSSRELMEGVLDLGVPALGVCLGSQMMARVLGGDVFRSERRNAFFSPVRVEGDDPVVSPFGDGTPVLQFHEDTFTLPPGATALARSERSGLLQAFRHGTNAYAVQFHFEVDEAIVAEWCDNIGPGELAGAWGTSKEELLAQAAQHGDAQDRAGRQLVRRFLGHFTTDRLGDRPRATGRAAAGPEGPAAGSA